MEHALAAAEDKEALQIVSGWTSWKYGRMSTHNVHKDGRDDGAGDGGAVLGRGILDAADKLLVAAAVDGSQNTEDDDGKYRDDGAARVQVLAFFASL